MRSSKALSGCASRSSGSSRSIICDQNGALCKRLQTDEAEVGFNQRSVSMAIARPKPSNKTTIKGQGDPSHLLA